MKNLLLFTLVWGFVSANALALVSEGKPQRVLVSRSDKGLVFTTDNKKAFGNVDDCAKYCYTRSSWQRGKSPWSNEVYVKFGVDLSKERRQYIGDRFVANKVYPSKVFVSFEYTYKPDDKSIRKKEEEK